MFEPNAKLGIEWKHSVAQSLGQSFKEKERPKPALFNAGLKSGGSCKLNKLTLMVVVRETQDTRLKPGECVS